MPTWVAEPLVRGGNGATFIGIIRVRCRRLVFHLVGGWIMVQIDVKWPREVVPELITHTLLSQGYALSTIKKRVRLLARLGDWLRLEGLGFSDLDDRAIGRFRVFHQEIFESRPAVLMPVVRLLRASGTIPPAPKPVAVAGTVEAALERWGDHLSRDRGLAPESIRWYLRQGRPFMLSFERDGSFDPSILTAADVLWFLGERIPELSDAARCRTVTALRSLLKFFHATGQIPDRLDLVVPAMAHYRDRGLPRWLRADQVSAIIESCDRSPGGGRRDRAIVLIIARLGLRACEVARLTLDDIQWRAGTIRIHGKGDYIDMMPLPKDVGAAVADHLADSRPPTATGRALFLTSCAPYTPLSAAAVGAVVAKAGHRAGLGLIGPHRLRHSVATATVNAGASLEEIGQLLRHRSLQTTTIYAKVDLVHLATMARPWLGDCASGSEPAPIGGDR